MGWPPAGTQEDWDRLRPTLHLGQRLRGTVAWVPKPGVIGFGVDLGLPVGGFVDVALLRDEVSVWPEVGAALEFEIWSMDERRPQIRLKPVDPKYLRPDFNEWSRRWPRQQSQTT